MADENKNILQVAYSDNIINDVSLQQEEDK